MGNSSHRGVEDIRRVVSGFQKVELVNSETEFHPVTFFHIDHSFTIYLTKRSFEYYSAIIADLNDRSINHRHPCEKHGHIGVGRLFEELGGGADGSYPIAPHDYKLVAQRKCFCPVMRNVDCSYAHLPL